ncbi:MAG: hypothetical protein PVH61_25040 [Candidatus Aminicenantes bacterium]|jgi:hypothetical protein
MKIDNKIRIAHRNLSDSSARFLEFIENNPDALKAANFKSLDINDKLYVLQPWPTFINQRIKNQMGEATIKIFNLIKGIPERIFASDPYKISQYLGIPVDTVKFQLDGTNERHIENLLARGDFILSAQGLKCLEYNVSANLGGWELPIWQSLYLKTPIISRFLKEYGVKIPNKNLISDLFDHLITAALDMSFDYDRGINIALGILYKSQGDYTEMELYMNQLYKQKLQQRNNKLRGKIIICDLNHLDMIDDCIFCEDLRIHSIIELHHGLITLEILQAFKAGNVCLYNGPITGLLSNKLILAILSEYEDSEFFSPEERETIKKYIPWTRKITSGETNYGNVKITLEDFILNHKDKLVIKASRGYGGKGIYVGRYTSQEKWEEVMKTAVKDKNYLVQEYIESPVYLYQSGEDGCTAHDAVWGFFVLGSAYADGWVRVFPTEKSNGVINCHQGAKISVIFEVLK